MNIPTRAEINVFDSLDERSACKNFLGKTIEEAEALFVENSLGYQWGLMWMGPVAFRYYIHAAINYVRSDASRGDSAVVNGLLSILGFWLDYQRAELEPVSLLLADFCSYVLQHYDQFDLDPEIYGDLRGKIQEQKNIFLSICPTGSVPPDCAKESSAP